MAVDEKLQTVRHSCAHVMAEAILKLFKWLRNMAAKKTPVHRRKRIGDVMLGAKALPRRNSK